MNRGLSAAVSLIFLVACDAGQAPWNTQASADAGPNRPPADVQLPPVPNLDLVDVPAQYDDGSYSVSGLMLARQQMRNMPVRVTAILHSIYQCEAEERGVEGEAAELAAPPEAERPFEVRPGCMRPHMYFVDSLRGRQRLLVTGYDAALYEPQMHPGQRYVLHGVYAQETRGFISTEDGLVVVDRIEGEGIVMPTAGAADATP